MRFTAAGLLTYFDFVAGSSQVSPVKPLAASLTLTSPSPPAPILSQRQHSFVKPCGYAAKWSARCNYPGRFRARGGLLGKRRASRAITGEEVETELGNEGGNKRTRGGRNR